ncbi:MAG: hypothetical protein RL095_1441 [Verrucomicrobiota bacterium]
MNEIKKKGAQVTPLGWPRIGRKRELKSALEAHWAGKIDGSELLRQAHKLEEAAWLRQSELGADQVPCNDLPLYDHVLSTLAVLGAVPDRFHGPLFSVGQPLSLEAYFAMARGSQKYGLAALEMSKWFDTNYHYIVPEFRSGMALRLDARASVDSVRRALGLGLTPRPVVLGPVSFLKLGRSVEAGFDPLSLLPQLLPLYRAWLDQLHDAGAEWIQLDEPVLCTDLELEWQDALRASCQALFSAKGPRILLVASHAPLDENLALALELDVDGLHIDAVRAGWEEVEELGRRCLGVLSVGVVDGRNVWRCALRDSLSRLRRLQECLGDRLWLSASCSFLHCPLSLEEEDRLDPDLRIWLAFAEEKLAELALLKRGLRDGEAAIAAELAAADAAGRSRAEDPRLHRPEIAARLSQIKPQDLRRGSSFLHRAALQSQRLQLPPLPTTTIGSFPQTSTIRQARAAYKTGKLGDKDYQRFLEDEIRSCIREQEELGLDVLVHGEAERNDMVEYFGEKLEGFAFTRSGWVQSYGSRCVKPPILFGDVERPSPISVDWARFAQSCSLKPVKGMLTGPVTILKWSFVRDDQPLERSCRQIALALRREVLDLEAAGIAVIQVDEPALREALPLRRRDRIAFLEWSVDCFRLSTAAVSDLTQIHSHMCYCDFGDIRQAIIELDADVLSLEAARSGMELLRDFGGGAYPNDLGPGVWDIHSPRVPPQAEIASRIRLALDHLPAERLWINPDCGLKTRGWSETRESLRQLVAATRQLRQELLAQGLAEEAEDHCPSCASR